MNQKTFNELLEARLTEVRRRLSAKRAEYSRDGDRLSHYKQAAALQRCFPARACFAQLAKHLVSLADMVDEEHSCLKRA